MGSIDVVRDVRIASASGAITDLPENLALLAENADIDFIVYVLLLANASCRSFHS